ncbi:3'-5' exonuclease [Saccharospirillum salsuginis]|uniref:3'-5' exonuclease n=1 Tax=Saccharospirillum salsuginis TaxID=418750 RepID=A0A918KDW4_9GAMM|nr:3'-5' exonuclease [Saccharospirillum salsuginis]GGX59734.1 3'-5' exonuclease [Saccharospirillum salsuginis]
MFYLNREPHPADCVPDWSERFQELAAQARDERLRRFYQAGSVTPDTPLSDVPFVALDFETTGLNPNRHSIVSIGLVPFDLNRIRVRGSKHWIVKPRLPLHQRSITFHRITHSDIRSAPDLDEVLDDLLQSLAGRIVVVHHRSIERQFLDVAVRVRLRESIEFPVVDTMELEARLHRKRRRGALAKLFGRDPVSIRLADSRERYGLPYYPPHHALTDAQASAELLIAQIADRFSPGTPIREIWA